MIATRTREEIIKEYLKKIKAANKELTKKEAFKDCLRDLYAGDSNIRILLDKISLGAETTIVNIPRKDKLHKGSADTLFNQIIIEFENDLKVTLNHAKEQLAGYLLGQFKSGKGYNYTLIVSDFINWKVYAPDISCLDKLNDLQEHELVLNEVPSASFTLSSSNIDNFYYWLDRFLFKEEKQKATLKRIEEGFGYQSNVFIESYRRLNEWFSEAKKYGEVQVSFEQWRKFLSIAYGSFDASESNFLIHTYLSVFSKMLAYSVVSSDDFIDDKEMKGILDGSIFHRYNIRNFVDNDFFHWVKSDLNFQNLKEVFRLISQEISTYDFSRVEEDILKGVYQELIDLDTRHALGEYYTPDWLCERIVNEFSFSKQEKILDPSCGSGSFLRAAIHRMRQLHSDISAEELCNQIHGIDIHPLSVQISKTTVLLALGKEAIRKSKRPVHINIIMANTLLAPKGVRNLWGGEFRMNIDKQVLDLNTHVLDDVSLFDEALEFCESLAELTLHKKADNEGHFKRAFENHFRQRGHNQQVIEGFYKIYLGFKLVKEQGRDSIWKFIVQNLYKPYFLAHKFDFIIGNPPWFTYGSIRNEEYQDTLNKLADSYHVKPEKNANFPNLEIASIFLAHCSSYFLKEGGKIAFVLPRSFFNADHHDNTRSGRAKGFKLYNIWDLQEVSPLFRVPSCVLFAVNQSEGRKFPSTGLSGLSFKATLPAHNCNLNVVLPKLKEVEEIFFYSKQGKTTAFSKTKTATRKVNPYKKEFKKGAELTPRSFYFIQVLQKPDDWVDRWVNIKTSENVKPDAKKPWKDVDIEGLMESRFLFRTALAKSILPFNLFRPELIALPIIVDNNHKKTLKLKSADEIRREGYFNAAKWFSIAEDIWAIYRTEKNKSITAIEYINWQNKLVSQNLNCEYLVLYNASAKDANATVIKRTDFDLEFIVDFVTYAFYTNCKDEAYYLAAILNSTAPNQMIKDFQAKGLYGARHVHKKILDIFYPKYNESSKVHKQLAELSEIAHYKATQYLIDNPPKQELTSIKLGRLRVSLKKYLKEELDQIDVLVQKVIG